MANDKLRAYWWHKQGLDGSLRGKSPAEILKRAGWARSVAGAGPYLTLFARGGFSRAEIDRAVAAAEIHELPAARGCTYILPSDDYALGLKVGQSFTEAETKVALKLGVTEAELATLRQAILKALALGPLDTSGPLDTDGLRAAVGAAARSLGPEGVKKGITTTLPVALGTMQSSGDIRRIPVNGRLDQQRYRYSLWEPNPLKGFELGPEASFTELGRKYFGWLGAAALSEFQWFSGLSGKAARAALEPLGLQTLETDEGPMLMPAEDREAFEHFEAPSAPQYVLVSSLDGMNALRRNVSSLLAPEDLHRAEGRKGRVADLPDHAILDRGRLVGFWAFDPATKTIAWMSFREPDTALREAVRKTEAFVRDELGDARSFSLDSPQSRIPRLEALRKEALQREAMA
jgi:hypothetical protein